jgi:hypothetical protein
MTKSDFELMVMALSSLSLDVDSGRSSVESQEQLADGEARTRTDDKTGLGPDRADNCEEKFVGACRNRTGLCY